MNESGGTIKGTAFYRERIALPPGAVFEAVLEDVSLQDIKAKEIGRTVMEDTKGPPYVFTIDYDPTGIDPRMSYAVRARILVDGKLLFSSDTMHPVLTRGAGSEVEIVMRMVGGRSGPTALRGVASIMAGEVGRDGDGAFFTDASTGKRHELAPGGERDGLDEALGQAGGEGGAVYMTFEGSVDDQGRVKVTRFINAWPGQSNERSRVDCSLTNTYWRIVIMRDEKVGVVNDKREPHILLKDVDGQARCSATVGCNQLAGGYKVEGDGLSFMMMATTMMACPPPLDALERTLGQVLAGTKRYKVKGPTLELYDEGGKSIALLEAVCL